jgi:hypothetical protein
MTMIIDRAERNEFGAIVGPIIAAMDPGSQIDEPPVEVNAIAQMRLLLRYLPSIGEHVHEAALSSARSYESTRTHPRIESHRSTFGASNYATVKAEAYVEYLDAIAAPAGVA